MLCNSETQSPTIVAATAIALAPIGGVVGYQIGRAVTYAVPPLNPVLGAVFGTVGVAIGGAIFSCTKALVEKKIINSNQKETVISIASIILYPAACMITCRCLHLPFTWKAFSLFLLGSLTIATTATLIALAAKKIFSDNKANQVITENNGEKIKS